MNERMAKMRGYRDMIGGLRASLLLGVSTAALLAGCDWFDGNTPVSSRQVRPGAERSVAVSNSLPAAGTGRQYDTGIAAVDETRGGGTQIGSIVAGKGGQKAQQEELAKAQRDSDRKAREENERRIAARKAEDALAAGAPPPAASTASATASVTAAAPPPPAPVTATPIAPPTETAAATPPAAPAQTATPPAPEPVVVAAVPARPADPNKAFEPPPGWVPPGQTAPIATASTTTAVSAAPPPATIAAPPPATVAAPPPVSTVATSTTLLPPPTETTAAAPPPVVVAAASAPARRVDPNKAFEPPPGWAPPGQAAPVATAAPAPSSAVVSAPPPTGATTMTTATTLLPTSTPPAPAVTTQVASVAPPSPVVQPPAYEPTPVTQVRSATPRVGAGESAMPSSSADRPGVARPADVAVAAPPAPVTVTPMAAPAAPAPAPITVTATPTAPPMNLQADIAHAQSGAVPPGTIKVPPGGPLQVAVIQFGRASSGLGGRDGDILKKIAQIQKKNGGTVRVVAHAEQDVTGSSVGQIEQGNYDVSRRRALNIANQLMALGVPRSAIIAEAASDSEPKYATNTARGIAANRRAEIFLDL